jgi:hypothetical protein
MKKVLVRLKPKLLRRIKPIRKQRQINRLVSWNNLILRAQRPKLIFKAPRSNPEETQWLKKAIKALTLLLCMDANQAGGSKQPQSLSTI